MWPGQKSCCNPLIFFLIKTISFWLKKKWPGRPGDPVKNQNPVLKL
jgi:hypothetical protein